jgi:hypothetical protein
MMLATWYWGNQMKLESSVRVEFLRPGGTYNEGTIFRLTLQRQRLPAVGRPALPGPSTTGKPLVPALASSNGGAQMLTADLVAPPTRPGG